MKKFYHKIRIILLSTWGCMIKPYIDFRIKRMEGTGINTSEERRRKVIVSLTSYGRRVKDILPYTIYSLLQQDYKPDAVILWLDFDNWNDNNLPHQIKLLQAHGLTVRYCKDLRSYKKHVPALSEYPEDLIITTDDDFYYAKDFVCRLISAFKSDPNRIYTHRAHRPTFRDGKLLPYDKWNKLVYNLSDGALFPTTGGGCLFQRHLLDDDALNEELFKQFCPTADDVWFYFMTIIKKTRITVLPFKEGTMIPLDTFYQLNHKGSSLQHENRGKLSLNDKQINKMMEHYNLLSSDLETSNIPLINCKLNK